MSGALSKKILGAKNMQNLARFRTNSKFDGEYLRNGWRYSKSDRRFYTAIPLALGDENWVNIGPRITEIMRWNRTHPNQLFQNTIFWPLGGAAPQIFTRVRKWPSLTSAPPQGREPPLQFFSRGGQKWALIVTN